MTAIVLAGGRSRRLGRNKALEQFGDRPLIQRVIDTVSLLDNDIVVVAASKGQLPQLDHRIRIVIDRYPISGALVGIFTGLKAARSHRCLAVACDMPFLNIDLLRYMISVSERYDAVIPRMENMIEPLHAVYSTDCIEPIQLQIDSGNLKISDLLSKIRVRYIDREEIERYDPQHLSFINVNSENDLNKARGLMEKVKR
jgi:molybdopterin-guanine dinucleotide biosynthesis protein A